MSGDLRQALDSYPTDLTRIYEPIHADMRALNQFLYDEFASDEGFVNDLLKHIAQYRGKQIRPAYLFLAARILTEVPNDAPLPQEFIKCAAIVELIHTATLVHDDILDDARLRRRVETVNQRWGERVAVLLGDFIYSRGFSLSTEIDGVSKLLADCTHTICEGELLQIGSAFRLDLTEARYNEIIRKKTAVLYGMACRCGALLAGASEDVCDSLESFGLDVGMAFQIADDALDLVGEEQVVGKSLGTDLRNGKLTLPLIRLRESLDGGKLQEFLWLLEHPNELGTQTRVYRMLEDQQVLPSVHETARSYIRSAVRSLERFESNPIRNTLVELSEFVLDRSL